MKTEAPTKPAALSPSSRQRSIPDKRARDAQLITLIQLSPQLVVDGSVTETGLVAGDVDSAGTMRETCPHCPGEPLQLVIRRKHVIRSHLFCQKCTRCYDAIRTDGSSAFATYAASLD